MSDNHTPSKKGIGFTEIFIGFIVIGLLSSMFLGSSKSSNSSNDASSTGFSPQECNYLKQAKPQDYGYAHQLTIYY